MITTRDYAPGDASDFLTVYRACLAHYDIVPATPAQEHRVVTLLDAGKHMFCLMAFHSDMPIGFATWTLTLPAGAGVALYMKELFVDPAARGKGVGRALLCGLIARAESEDCTRIDWQTDAENPLSQAFYAGIGAPTFGKLSYRIGAAEFAQFRSALRDG